MFLADSLSDFFGRAHSIDATGLKLRSVLRWLAWLQVLIAVSFNPVQA